MSPTALADRLDGIVHEETQVGDRGVDLTVAEVYEVETPGRVDFGGGELEAADLAPRDRVWRDESDDYQWWDLDGGQYLLAYNESLSGGDPVVVQTRDEVAERGAFHPTRSVTSLDYVPLAVAPGGLRLKENARVSTVVSAGRF
jgi:hypothetical protein